MFAGHGTHVDPATGTVALAPVAFTAPVAFAAPGPGSSEDDPVGAGTWPAAHRHSDADTAPSRRVVAVPRHRVFHDARLARISKAGRVLPSSTSRKAPPPVEM